MRWRSRNGFEAGRVRFFAAAFLLFMTLLNRPWPAPAGEPTEKIRTIVQSGVQVLETPNLSKKERVNRLRELVYPLFDFTEMAKRSLGPQWRRLTAAQQQEFVRVFREFLENVYAGQIDLYNGQKVVFSRELMDGRYAEVDSKVIDQKGEQYSVQYRLLQTEGGWKVYDIVVENVSLVNNYRSQFQRILTGSSYEELLKRLKQKAG